MKVLVLGSRVPYPLHDGGAIATYTMLREMARQGAEVTFFTLNTKKHFVGEDVIAEAFPFCKVITSFVNTDLVWYKALFCALTGRNYNIWRFNDAGAKGKLTALLQNKTFDIVHFEGLFTTPLVSVVKAFSGAPMVLRAHNVEYQIWERLSANSTGLKQKYLKFLAKGLKKYEKQILQKFPVVVPIAQADEAVFKQIHPQANYFYYPAGLNPDQIVEAKPIEQASFSHIGSMEWMPNVEALIWFVREVWPGIIQKFPHAAFHIAGKGLTTDDNRFAGKGIINHGEVDDARMFQKQYGIAVVPLFSGSGLRMKTLEAMALGKPVISTSLGAEGIPYTHQKDIYIADTAQDFIHAAEKLLMDPAFAASMGKQAKEMVTEAYSITSHTKRLLDFYQSLSTPA